MFVDLNHLHSSIGALFEKCFLSHVDDSEAYVASKILGEILAVAGESNVQPTHTAAKEKLRVEGVLLCGILTPACSTPGGL